MDARLVVQKDGTGSAPRSASGREIRILLTSAGRRVELLQCFRAAAAELGVDARILACDLNPALSAACQLADAAFPVPRADDPGYVDAVLRIAAENGAQLVVPTIDPELPPLARARDRFAALGARVAISDPQLVDIARDKLATARFLAGADIPSPRTALLDDAATEEWQWPVIVKPNHGSASRGVRLVASAADLPLQDPSDPLIVQQRLVGTEHTVNLFFDRCGELRCAVPHRRLQVRAGEVEKGVTCRDTPLIELARRLAAALPGPRGALCFQAMVDADGNPSVFEINARFGGGYPLAHQAGATFTRWLIEETLGLPSTASDSWSEGVTMLRYDAAVFR